MLARHITASDDGGTTLSTPKKKKKKLEDRLSMVSKNQRVKAEESQTGEKAASAPASRESHGKDQAQKMRGKQARLNRGEVSVEQDCSRRKTELQNARCT